MHARVGLMSRMVFTNWFGDVTSRPHVIADVTSVGDIIAILKDPARYPSPVRAVGSKSFHLPHAAPRRVALSRMK